MSVSQLKSRLQTLRASQLHSLPLVTALLCLLIALSPLIPFQALSGTGHHDGQRMMASLYLTVGMLIFVWRVAGRVFLFIPLGPQSTKFAAFFWVLGLISAMASYSPRHALYEWASLATLFLVSCLVAGEIARRSSKLLDQTLLCCGVACSLYIFQALVAYAAALVVGQQPDSRDLIVGFDNHRFFNHVQTISLPLLGILASRKFKTSLSTHHHPTFWFVVLLLWWMLTFVSAGRGTFLGVWCGMLVAMVFNPTQAWPWFRTMLLSCVAGLAACFFLYWLVPQMFGLHAFGFLFDVVQRTAADPSNGRWPLWQRAFELTLGHPWLGVGPLHFAHYSQDLTIAAHPHNAPLQIASEWGVPALFALCALLISGVRALLNAGRAVSATDFRHQTLFSAFLAAGVSIAVDSLVSGLIVMPLSQLWIALYTGCAWGWAHSQVRSCVQPELKLSSAARYALMAGILILVALHIRGLWPELLDLPSHEAKSKTLGFYTDLSNYTPRIWRAGYF